MLDSDALQSAIADVSTGNVTTGLEFTVRRTIEAKRPEGMYMPEGEPLIMALAAAPDWQRMAALDKLKAAFGKDYSRNRIVASIKHAKDQLRQAELREAEPDAILRSDTGRVMVGHENAFQYFKSSPEWQGVLAYNEFTGGIELRDHAPEPITLKKGEELDDTFDTNAVRWLERRSKIVWNPNIVHRVVNSIARENSFHPVREYLTGLEPWDGIRRLDTWLHDYCGVDIGSDERPNHLAEFGGRMFMISAVARIMTPGCQVDHMLIWEGKTGLGKSSATKALLPDKKWYAELETMEGKDASMDVRGVWIIELPELDSLLRTEERTAKKFISKQEERLRLPYERRVSRFPRQCVFIGTTERDDWMRAETGRRYWPVRCTNVDVERIAVDRDLLWAEALHAFTAGERWYPKGEEVEDARREQKRRYVKDILTSEVLVAVGALESFGGEVSTGAVAAKMGIAVDKRDVRLQSRIAQILRMDGYDREGDRWVKRG